MNINKTKTTYGVYNLIEWYARLRMGKAYVKVAFTGGSITTQGVTPATFTTENPVIQLAIERSPEFLKGKIKVVRRTKLNDTVEIESNVPKAAPEVPCTLPASHNEKDEDIPNTEAGSEAKEDETTEESPANTRAEFSCNDDAKDFLEERFGLVRSKLRNREDIVAAGKAHGVDIIFV